MIGGGPKKKARDIAKIQSILSELTDREAEEVLKELKKVQEKGKKEKKILRQEATTATYHENATKLQLLSSKYPRLTK